MSYSKIDRSRWKGFFDAVSKAVEGRLVELDIVGEDIGDQEYGNGLNLSGMTYEPSDDTLYVSMSNATRPHIDHVVPSPQEVHVEFDGANLSSMMVKDLQGHEQFVRLRQPLSLPA